jgi:type VI protein secretion system component VasF
MPRKTAAEKARNSAGYHKRKIQEAYTAGEIDAPLTQAMRWLYAALAQRAREDPAAGPALYRHATESLAEFAEQIQNRIISESERKAT